MLAEFEHTGLGDGLIAGWKKKTESEKEAPTSRSKKSDIPKGLKERVSGQ